MDYRRISPGIRLLIVIAIIAPLASAVAAETFVDSERKIAVDSARGVDRDVDYAALVRMGPWDDRNYQLTKEDLAILPENEEELSSPIPAFFRVEYRKAWAANGHEPFAQYPLSAFNEFRQNRGGYLVRGTPYRKATRLDGQYYVDVVSDLPELPAPSTPSAFLEGESRVTNPNGAAESAIAISPTNTQKVVAGSNGPGGGQRMHYSQDGGVTWTQVNLPLGGTCCDPTVEWSSDGRYAYTATLGSCGGGCGLWFYRSDDGGVTWNSLEEETPGDPRREVVISGADREYLHVDHSPASPYKDNIYLVWHQGNVMRFGKSEDFGDTWSTIIFPGGDLNRGIAGDVATDRDGNIFYAWPTFNNYVRLRISNDGGNSFEPIQDLMPLNSNFLFPIPAVETREVSNYVSAGADTTTGPFSNRIYFAWADTVEPESDLPVENHAWIRFAYSPDGQNWKIRTPHEIGDLEEVDRWQPFIGVGPDGTVHIIFYDTRNSPDRTAADLYYAFSMDGGDTWSPPERITTEMSPNIDTSFEFGDYSGMDIVMNDLIAIFTDNRNETGGAGDSVDVYSAGIGPGGAGAAGRIPGSQAVAGNPLVLTRNGTDIDLLWEDACGAVTDYAVYEGLIGEFGDKTPLTCSTGGSTMATVTPSPGARFYIVVANSNDTVEGSYGQTNTGDERQPSADACFLQTIESCP